LPGIGAFALRPRELDAALGRAALEAFLRGVIDHVADRASQDERYRYWRAVVRGRTELGSAGKELPRLATPPRDARVLAARLGSDEEAEWTARIQTYCMSAGDSPGASAASSEQLAADWLLLAGRKQAPQLWLREGAWFVQTADQLAEAGFPRPTSNAYLCAAVRLVTPSPRWLADVRLETLGVDSERIRSSCSWADVLSAGQQDVR
jgi:hypothetical protein